MGNTGSRGGRRRNGGGGGHRHHHRQQQLQEDPSPTPPEPTLGPQQAEVHGNRYVFAAATPYPNPHLPNPNAHHQYFHYNGYYPPPLPSPLPYDVHHQRSHASHDGPALSGWAYSGRRHHPNAGHVTHAPMPYVEHQKAVTIRNDVNLKKETLHMEPDEENPGRFLVAFTLDATNAGRISIFFFSKEGSDCSLASVTECFEPVTVSFKEGLGQKFRQPSGTGIDFSSFEEAELCKEGNLGVFPLAVKAEASSSDEDGNQTVLNSQITKAVFEKKEKDCYQVRVIKQILWVNSTRYELQEIYGIGNSVDNDFDGSDQGKECVICLSEPRDTTVLPCRHMEQYQVLLEYVLLKVKDSEAAEARQRCRVIVGSEGGRIACAVKRLRSPD